MIEWIKENPFQGPFGDSEEGKYIIHQTRDHFDYGFSLQWDQDELRICVGDGETTGLNLSIEEARIRLDLFDENGQTKILRLKVWEDGTFEENIDEEDDE